MCGMAMALQVNLTYPVCGLGSRSARTGPPATRHLPPSMCVFHDEHGKLSEGCEGEWAGGKGDPNETPRPQAVAERASESEDGTAVYTRMRTDGEGPEPLEVRSTKSRRRTKYPANAEAVHERCLV